MNPYTGQVVTIDELHTSVPALERDAYVEMFGPPDSIERISRAVARSHREDQQRKARRAQQKQSRRGNRR